LGCRVEQFEQIRRDREREGLSIHALAERYGVHRRTVRQALTSPLPPARRSPVGRPAPKLGPYAGELLRSRLPALLRARADRHSPRRRRRRQISAHTRKEAVLPLASRTGREHSWPECSVHALAKASDRRRTATGGGSRSRNRPPASPRARSLARLQPPARYGRRHVRAAAPQRDQCPLTPVFRR
jgi:transcriptional regulator with XRE-family HTH domain